MAQYYLSENLIISSSLSNGNGGIVSGFNANKRSFIGSSSAAMRFELKCPHLRQRCINAHSPSFLVHIPMASIIPPQCAALSPGIVSRCKLERQCGPWLRYRLPAPVFVTVLPQPMHMKSWHSGMLLFIYVCVLFLLRFFKVLPPKEIL